MNTFTQVPKIKNTSYFKKFSLFLITFIFIPCSIIFAGDVPEPMDLLLTIKYPKLLDSNNYIAESKFSGFRLNTEIKTQKETKSKGKAFLFSLLLPGAGEYYLGKKTVAKSFFITELVLWAGYFSFKTYGDWQRDDMYVYASTHADADVKGKPSQFFVDIGNYHDIYEYNDAKQRRRETFNIYDEEDYYWLWDSSENQYTFEQMRISSDKAHHRATLTVGGIIANHVLSAIDAVWQSYRYNKNLNNKNAKLDKGIKVHFGGLRPSGCVLVSIKKVF